MLRRWQNLKCCCIIFLFEIVAKFNDRRDTTVFFLFQDLVSTTVRLAHTNIKCMLYCCVHRFVFSYYHLNIIILLLPHGLLLRGYRFMSHDFVRNPKGVRTSMLMNKMYRFFSILSLLYTLVTISSRLNRFDYSICIEYSLQYSLCALSVTAQIFKFPASVFMIRRQSWSFVANLTFNRDLCIDRRPVGQRALSLLMLPLIFIRRLIQMSVIIINVKTPFGISSGRYIIVFNGIP